jgi:DNA sulfur modification protein DndE
MVKEQRTLRKAISGKVDPSMKTNKIRVSKDATQKLQTLKARTGLTPNILSRLGFCLSLADPTAPNEVQVKEDGMEFNRYTLTGLYDNLFVSLLKERCVRDGIDLEDNLEKQFLLHLNRGIFIVHSKIRRLSDLMQFC